MKINKLNTRWHILVFACLTLAAIAPIYAGDSVLVDENIFAEEADQELSGDAEMNSSILTQEDSDLSIVTEGNEDKSSE